MFCKLGMQKNKNKIGLSFLTAGLFVHPRVRSLFIDSPFNKTANSLTFPNWRKQPHSPSLPYPNLLKQSPRCWIHTRQATHELWWTKPHRVGCAFTGQPTPQTNKPGVFFLGGAVRVTSAVQALFSDSV